MQDIQQKVAYLQGLTDGMELDQSKEGKIIREMLNVLEQMADYIGYLNEQIEDMDDYMESIDSDLTDVEDEVFGVEEDEYDEEDDGMVDVVCPNCHEEVCFDASILYDDDLIEVTCPNCDAVVFVNDGNLEGGEEEAEEEE